MWTDSVVVGCSIMMETLYELGQLLYGERQGICCNAVVSDGEFYSLQTVHERPLLSLTRDLRVLPIAMHLQWFAQSLL